MLRLYDEVELPLSRVLAFIERHGVKLDVACLRALSVDVDGKLQALEREVRDIAGLPDLNLGSPKQLQELLFEKLALPGTKRTKTGWSTDADVLEELAPLHPVAAKILEHRVLAKLKGTYLDALPALVDPRSGRLHTSYKQAVAATGRLSSADPNLQNVPIRTELGREIRRAFVAEANHLLVVGDYSQIELRVLAHLSGDPVLTDAFRKDEDIHRRTVTEMFGAARADDPQLRSVAKMINYGIVYGLSDFGLAQRLGIERADAKRYIEGYLRTYAGVARYMEGLIDEARRAGGARTLLGRFRPLPELASRNRNVRMYGERMARNTPIQGTAADLLKLAMIEVQRFLDADAPATRMLLTVHDELVLEAPAADAERVAARLQEVMEGVMPLGVPLKVDLGIGASWADAK
jgi:DNA polymerase-1